MINIFFPAGAFGSTLEYSIRNFTNEFNSIEAVISPLGSMHSFHKEFHPVTVEDLKNITPDIGIVTPVYPNLSFLSTSETIDKFIELSLDTKVIFIILNSAEMVERNWLFSYYKIEKDQTFAKANFRTWNPAYESIDDMAIWERRECLSFIIRDSIDDFMSAKNKKMPDWLMITADDILFNFKETLEKICSYLNLTMDYNGLDKFIAEWQLKQQYIVDEMKLVTDIIENIQRKQEFNWEKSLSLPSEAIIQQRLVKLGYKFKCCNLNQFPSTTTDLLELCEQLNI